MLGQALRGRAGRFVGRAVEAPPPEDGPAVEDNSFAAAERTAHEAEAALGANIARRRQLAAEIETLRGRHEDAISAGDIDAALQFEPQLRRLQLELRAAESEATPLNAAFERARAVLAQLHTRAAWTRLEAAQSVLDDAALALVVALDDARAAHYQLMRLGGTGPEGGPPALEVINGWYVSQCCHRARLRLTPPAA